MHKHMIVVAAAIAFGFGVVVGPQLVGTAEAAREATYTECVAVTVYVAQGKAINQGQQPANTVRIPSGWTPIGGAGPAQLIICR